MHRLLVAITALLLMSPQSLAESLPLSTPEAQGFDSGKLAAVVLAAKESGQPVHSLLVVRRGNVVLDTDFYPYDGSLHDVASVTKSVTTSLIGIAAGEGLLDLDAPMLSFLPGRSIANRDERKERITVRQLTQNLSGLACVGYPEEVTLGQMAASVDFVQFTLDLPMSHEPGKHFAYCSPGMHLLTAVLQQATGRTALDFAKEKLFAPLGITDIAWDNDPQGITRGWGDLHLIPGDMAKLGLLWLQDGDWQGQSVIPSDWLSAATTQAVKSDRYEDYGYGFWIGPESEPIPYFMASGRGGQRIIAAPAIELVIVTTGGGMDPGQLTDAVVGALVDLAEPLPANSAGVAELSAAVKAAAAAPPPGPAPVLPALAGELAGRVYSFPDNAYGIRWMALAFPGGAEGQITIAVGDDETPRPVGLDGRYRWSEGPNGIRFGDKASWVDGNTIVIDHNTIGDIGAYSITAQFESDTLRLTIVQRDEVQTITLVGTRN
jgi:CubicO group peptidase (beta-lactamase class C family)